MFEEAFARDGLLVIERLFEPDLIRRIADTVHGWTGPIDPENPPRHMAVDAGRLQMPVRMEGPLIDPAFWGHPILDRLLGSLLGGDYLIDSVTVVNALPGAPTMHLHRDVPLLFGEVGADLPPYAVSLIVPLVETDDDTGTTSIARASRASVKSGPDTLQPDADWVAPHLPLGGCILMDYRLWHRGLPNRSTRERPILYMVFARPWFTDSLNFDAHPRMLMDKDALKSIDPAHRSLFRRAAGVPMDGLGDR